MVSALELSLRALSDEQQLQWAAADGRCLVIRDEGDFFDLTDLFRRTGRDHHGVAVVPGSMLDRDIGGIVGALQALAVAYPEGLPAYMMVYLWRSDR